MNPLQVLVAILVCLTAGCADEFIVYHHEAGTPLVISRRAYSPDGCVSKLSGDATRMGVTFRHVNVRGSVIGRSLLWPFEPGYACEAAIGPERGLAGSYPIEGPEATPGFPGTATDNPFRRTQ
jgi:hypothetical protein